MKGMMKRGAVMLILSILSVSILPVNGLAEGDETEGKTEETTELIKDHAIGTIVDTGTCGEGLTYTITVNGKDENEKDTYTLTINGSGEMYYQESIQGRHGRGWDEYKDALTGLILSEKMTTIGEGAFSGCSRLSGKLNLPKTISKIGPNAFSGCSGLTGSLVLPEKITNIAENTFSGCSGFTEDLVLPEGITEIGAAAFFGCSGLNIL